MSATTVGCRCTSKRKCPWTSCTPRAPSPSPSSAPSAACGKCSRCDSRPGSPRARPHSHPGRVLPPSGLLRQPRFHVGAPPTVRKRSQTPTTEPTPFAPGAGAPTTKLVEVLGGVPFGHLFVQLAPGTVDLAAALYCGPYGDLLGPAHEVGIALRIEEFGGAVHLVGHYAAIPGPDGHVGDAVLVPGDIGVVGQLP